jgi:hypothetical protein
MYKLSAKLRVNSRQCKRTLKHNITQEVQPFGGLNIARSFNFEAGACYWTDLDETNSFGFHPSLDPTLLKYPAENPPVKAP